MIKNVDFQNTLETAFLAYAASIAQERAIPDVRDGLKIGLRQGLYAQYTNKLTHKDKFQKAQKSVAAAMAQSYVHGDVAMYDTFIRAARPWSYSYPLEDVQGSYGNQSSPDSHAAARYVEMRASDISNYLFDGLKKNAIGTQWYWNYDDTEQIPSVFPSIGYWNIVNGCTGIAVAMATSVPQFNLKEVNEALIKIIQNPNIDFDEIYCAPDFACGGTITNGNIIKESLRYGKGESIRLQANLQYFPEENMIQATELPYGVFTNTIIDQLAALTEDNPSYGIDRVIDYTKQFADIRIYLSKGVNPKTMIKKLYNDTSLANWYSVNMVLLDQGRYPRIFGWREACDAYIAHIRECKRNIIQFDLDKALARKNIVEGLIKAYSIIDEVVATIRSSDTTAIASTRLIEQFSFNEEQTKAILAMRLSSLTKMDIVKLENELAELEEKIAEYYHLLNESSALDQTLINALQEVSNKFGKPRKTKILNINVQTEETIETPNEENVSIMLFDNNMLRIMPTEQIQGAKRGRKGINIKSPKNSNLINTLYTTNLSMITAFTTAGRMYNFALTELEYDKDYSVYEIMNIDASEKVILLIDTTSFNSYQYLVTVSKYGYIKKTRTTEYNIHAKKGTYAVKLDETDNLIGAYLCNSDNDKIFIANTTGYYNMYPISEVSTTGRVTKGVKSIKLNSNDYICSATLFKDALQYKGLLSITTDGQGKITPIEEYSLTSRASKGSVVMNLKDCQLATVYAVPDNKEKLYLLSNNKVVMLDISSIPVQNKNTMGSKLINTKSTTIEIL